MVAIFKQLCEVK